MNSQEYSDYHNSNVSYIDYLPKSWNISKVKYCFIRKNKKAHEENPVVLSLTRDNIKIRDISTGEGQLAESYYNYNPVDAGDLLLNPMDLYSGANCNVSKVKGVISPAYVNLRAKNNIDSRYYDYYFKIQYWSLAFFAHGKGVSEENRWTLNNETLMNYFVPVPDFEIQKQIADFLDNKISKIDSVIGYNQKLIELLEEKRVALINRVVTKGLNPDVEMKNSGVEWIGEIPEHWDIEKLKNISQVKLSNVDKKSKDNEPTVLLCNYTDVYNNEFITMNLDFMKATASYDQIRKLSLDVGDIIITKDSESSDDIAVPAIVTEELDNVVCGYHLAVIQANTNVIYPKFLFRSFESDEINKQFEYGANGFTRVGLGLYIINNAHVCVPPLFEQKQIANYLDKEISNIIKAFDKIKEHTELLEEYKESLIYHVVTGKINVRGEI